MDDGTTCEEYVEDASLVGCRHDRPGPSFCMGRNVFAGYFLAVRLADGDLHPFCAVTNPNLDPCHRNQI
jgi:hypothetical protein